MLAVGHELRAVGVLPAQQAAGVLDDHHLHAQADPEAGQLDCAGPAGRVRPCPRCPAGRSRRAPASRRSRRRPPPGSCPRARSSPSNLTSSMRQPLAIAPVVAGPRRWTCRSRAARCTCRRCPMRTCAGGAAVGVDHLAPVGEVAGRNARGRSLRHDDLVELLLGEDEGDLVDRGAHVVGRDHRLLVHVGEQRDLAAQVLRQRHGGAAQQHVGLDADLAQLAHRVLGGLGLRLPV